MSALTELLEQAHQRRVSLVERLQAEGTDCYRLFHGVVEGRPGLSIDRYGELILAQTFREPLPDPEVDLLQRQFGPRFVYNHRPAAPDYQLHHQPPESALQPVWASEGKLQYQILPRHRGIDPHLFLDFRVARRWVRANSRGRSVLNLFAYSCGLGQVAVEGGASLVWNVDFSASALRIGRKNLAHNQLPEGHVRFLQQDCFPVLWQLSGLGVKGKRARKTFVKLEPRRFDLVLLDPPRKAKGPFQAVDLINDYQSLFKPALLTCAEGGTVLATNNVGKVAPEEFERILLRCAEKAGRPLRSLQWLTPEEDFPSFDGRHPLKMAVCQV